MTYLRFYLRLSPPCPGTEVRLMSPLGNLLYDRLASYVCNPDSPPYFRSASARVIVQASDVNDHSPVFEELEYHVAVSESDLLNSRFLQVTATDEDLGMLSY